MKLPNWVQLQLDQGSLKTHLLLGLGTILVVATLYQLVLASYVQNFIALNDSLKSHQALLNNKTLRTQAIQTLKNAQNEYIQLLDGINGQFFTDVEADLFIKGLPSTLSSAGTRVILLKPKLESTKKALSDQLSEHVQGLNISSKDRLLAFIAEHKEEINSNQNTPTLQNQMCKMLPESKHEEFQALWADTSTDPLALAGVTKLELEVLIQGSYFELVEVLTYLKNINKGLDIQQINVLALNDGELETSFIVSIYSVQTNDSTPIH